MTSKDYIVSVLKTNKDRFTSFGVSKLGLFGSYVREEQTPDSDIDIFVDFVSEKENYDNLLSIYEVLEELFKNEKIEVVTKNGLSKYIGKSILEEVQYV